MVKTGRMDTEPLPRLPLIARDYAFRLGTPSYVYPAGVLPNVSALAGRVDDIELVLFESDNGANMPSDRDLTQLAELAAAHDLTYTVHLPLDRQLGAADSTAGREACAEFARVIRRTLPLRPRMYVMHLEGIASAAAPADVAAWRERVALWLPELIAAAGGPDRLCVENLSWPFAWCEALLAQYDLGVCLDTGHLELQGGNLADFWRRYGARVRVVHWHGVCAGRDHQSLRYLPPDRVGELLDLWRDFRGVVTLEIFNFNAMAESFKVLEQCRQLRIKS